MISVEEARKIIKDNVKVGSTQCMPLDACNGLVLSEDIFASRDFPPFLQSGVDGYAFRFREDIKSMELAKVIAAGDHPDFTLPTGKVARIFTGAPLPPGADTVVMQEKVSLTGNIVSIKDPNLKCGSNVRAIGSEIEKSSLALSKYSVLIPPAIGFLSGIGITEAEVYKPPVISLIITGNELQKPGTALEPGKVFESNSVALSGALRQLSVAQISTYFVSDDLNQLTSIVNTALQHSDMVLLTGGVSVGDYDFVSTALKNCGVKICFHGVRQKPGKPFLFATSGHIPVFGLPGNPSSVLTCYYEYVLPAIQQKMGFQNCGLKTVRLPLTESYRKPKGLFHFLKAFCNDTAVTPLPAQESYKMKSFAIANCFICLEEDKEFYEKDEAVEVHMLS